MTSPGLMHQHCACGRVHSETDPRGLIVAALHRQADEDFDWSDAERFADALLPVVRAIAAEELRALAKDLRSGGYEPYPENGWPHFDCEDLVAEHVEARADALDGGR